MNRALLVRHGESEHHVRDVTGGWTDLPLTTLGQLQSRRVAARIGALGLPRDLAVYTSDLVRASQTASAIVGELSCDLRVEPALRELNNGRAAGMTLSQAIAIERPLTVPAADWVAYEGGESWHAMARRVFAWLDRIEREGPEVVVLVGHGGSLSAVVRWWLGLSASNTEMVEFEFAPASLTELRMNQWRERTIVQLSDVSHLSP